MKLKQAIEAIGSAEAIRIAEELSVEMGVNWHDGACYVFFAIANDPDRVPGNIGGSKDDELNAIRKWLKKYREGLEGRASKRVSNLPGTIADPIIETMIGARSPSLTDEDLKGITFAHRLGMSAENILGLILEEYLSDNLQASGWHCAWGETVKSVDFVHEDGRLLQIKNRSNSENSSSSTVRHGTEIQKWFRIRHDRVQYMWDDLNAICGTTHLSEEGFVDFVESALDLNPECLAVEPENPWV